MALPSAYSAYKDSRIMTASPAELTLLLYEGAIKFCNLAMISIKDKDYENANLYIQKTERIINEFRATLDKKYPVSEDFDRIYEYLERRLLRANIDKDNEILEEVLGRLRQLRETWKEVMKTAKR